MTLLYAGAIPLCLWLLVRYPFEMDRLPLYFLAPLIEPLAQTVGDAENANQAATTAKAIRARLSSQREW